MNTISMNTVSKLVLILFIFGSITFTSCQKVDINDLIEKVKHSNNGDEEGDKDDKDGDKGDKDDKDGKNGKDWNKDGKDGKDWNKDGKDGKNGKDGDKDGKDWNKDGKDGNKGDKVGKG